MLCIKRRGYEVVFGRYPHEQTAHHVVEQLAAIGCPARAVPAQEDDVAGVRSTRAHPLASNPPGVTVPMAATSPRHEGLRSLDTTRGLMRAAGQGIGGAADGCQAKWSTKPFTRFGH